MDVWHFDGSNYPGGQDFSGRELFTATAGTRQPQAYAVKPKDPNDTTKDLSCPVAGSKNLNWLWELAQKEWA